MSKTEKDKKETAKKEEAKKDTKKEDAKKEDSKKESSKKVETKTAVKEEKPETKEKKTPAKEEKAETEKKTSPEPKEEQKPADKKEEAPVEPKPKKPKASVEEEEPKEVKHTFENLKLFNKWSYKDVVVTDPGLKAYISLKPVIAPHTGGRYEHQRFKKAEMPIIERLVNKLMRTGKGTGKKTRMINAVKVAFEIINVQTGKNPIQVFIDALQNAAPREEVTRITYGGMAQLQSVDVAPMRRVDIALTNIIEGVYKKSFNNILTAEEILARELIEAADNKTTSYAISKMQEIERVALSAR